MREYCNLSDLELAISASLLSHRLPEVNACIFVRVYIRSSICMPRIHTDGAPSS